LFGNAVANVRSDVRTVLLFLVELFLVIVPCVLALTVFSEWDSPARVSFFDRLAHVERWRAEKLLQPRDIVALELVRPLQLSLLLLSVAFFT
jgi:hypothetical protein